METKVATTGLGIACDDRNQQVIVGPALLLRLQDADKTDDPRAVTHKEAIPATGKLGGVQVLFIGDSEEQAAVAAPVLDKRSDIKPQVEG